MCIKTHHPETGSDGADGEASELTERRDPEPAERRYHLLTADRRDIERCEKRRIVLDDVDRSITGGSGSGMFRGERAVGEPNPVPVTGHPIDLLHDPLDKRTLTAVVTDRSGHRDENQSWFDDFDLWNKSLDFGDDPFDATISAE